MTPPKQTAAHTRADQLPPHPGAVVNVGDLISRLGGCACPAGPAWPITADKAADRRAFAAAFAGVSDSYHDPRRALGVARTVKVLGGGSWSFPCAGDVKKGQPVGPTTKEDGTLDPHRLAACEPDESIGEATEDAKDGAVGVVLRV